MSNKYLESLKKHLPGVAEENLLKALGVGFSMALLAGADKKLTKEEVHYMRREIKNHVSCDDEQMKVLVDFCLYQVVKKSFRFEQLEEFLPILNSSMDILQKQDLITSLFIISRSDLEMSKEEDRLINKIADRIDLEKSMADVLKGIQQIILDNKLGNSGEEYEIVHGADKFND